MTTTRAIISIITLLTVAWLLYSLWPQLKTGVELARQVHSGEPIRAANARTRAVDAAIAKSEGRQ